MSVTEALPHVPQQWASIIALGFLVFGVLAKLAESSEKFAKLLGPVGGWIQGRAERKVRRIREERRNRRDGEAADITDMQRQIDALAKRVELVDLLGGYIAYDTEWHVRESIRHAGSSIQLAKHMSFDEWCIATEPIRTYYGGPASDVADASGGGS